MSLKYNNNQSQYQLKVEDNDQKIEAWLTENISNMSPEKVDQLITENQILINKSVCKNKNTILKQGDEVIVNVPPDFSEK